MRRVGKCLLCLVFVGCGQPEPANGPGGESPPEDAKPAAAPFTPVELKRVTQAGSHEQDVGLPTGETLRYGISIPEGHDGEKPVPLVVALHYGGEVKPYYGKGMMDGLIAPGLKEAGAIIVAPDAQGGEDWTSERNEQIVVWLTRSVMKTYAIDPKKVLLTGFSMGGVGTWHIAGRHQDLFTAALPIAGKPAGQGVEWKIPLYVVHSKNDDVFPFEPVEKHVKELGEMGADVLLAPVEGLGHYETNAYAGPLSGAMGWLMQVWKSE